jgi:DNA-directed RNA polymerase specialized sigma24 family protein
MMTAEQAAAAFDLHRGYLTAVAYRMLGTLADAEDAVQETYLRFARADDRSTGSPVAARVRSYSSAPIYRSASVRHSV